jgi:hypothetical protein
MAKVDRLIDNLMVDFNVVRWKRFSKPVLEISEC